MKTAKNSNANFFKINLLIHKGEEIKLHIKLLKWLLTSGRYIVIFVEIIVIGAFVYRYKLDADLADLQEKIKEQIPYVQSLGGDEVLIRQTQFQLATVKQIRKGSPNFAQVLKRIASLTPQTVKLTNIGLDRSQSFSKTSLTISGQAPSSLELTAFINALQKDSTFIGITLTNISFDTQTSFTITGTLSETGGKSS